MRTLDLFVYRPDEQMPEDGQDVLCWTRQNVYPTSCRYHADNGGGWFIHDAEDDEYHIWLKDIIAWCVAPDRKEVEANERL